MVGDMKNIMLVMKIESGTRVSINFDLPPCFLLGWNSQRYSQTQRFQSLISCNLHNYAMCHKVRFIVLTLTNWFGKDKLNLTQGFFRRVIVSINSIDHTEIADVSSKWDYKDETASNIAQCKRQQAETRRRIEMLRDIRDSGLTIAEAKELGLIH